MSTFTQTSKTWVTPDAASILLLSTSARGQSVRIPASPGEMLRIGQAKDNDLVVPDRSVSRRHLGVLRTPAGLQIKDLESRNGVFVGGARVTEALVAPGTIIQIGDATLLVRVDTEGAVVPPSARDSFGLALGRSIAMRRIFGVLERIAATDATVLFLGETGTGKDVLAQSLHRESARRAQPFEVVDCGAIAPSLIESELFGHEKGAFTGAAQAHEGAFERAHGGTLFLDELGELPLELQPKLLRALEARQIRRVGGKRVTDIDVRVIAATTRDLPSDVAAGTFRQDLYFRLAVVPVRVPPLRERLEDVPILAAMILERAQSSLRLAPSALAQLASYAWPGNVRELRNVLERSAYFAQGSGEQELRSVIMEPATTSEQSVDDDVFAFAEGTNYRDARARVEAEFERRFVAWLLARNDGNIAAAAREAKMDRKYLGDLVRRHGRG